MIWKIRSNLVIFPEQCGLLAYACMAQYVNERHGVDSFEKHTRPSPQCTKLRLVAPDKTMSEDLWLEGIVGTTTTVKEEHNMQIHNIWLRAERAGCRSRDESFSVPGFSHASHKRTQVYLAGVSLFSGPMGQACADQSPRGLAPNGLCIIPSAPISILVDF